MGSLIGKTIALYNPTHKRFVRMPTGALMDKSGERPDGTLPSGWIWEMFKVVDAGNGLIALYNPTHKRFVRMPTGTNMDKSAVTDGNLPKDWPWEVFKIVEIGNGLIALYNPTHKRFVRMPTGTNMDKSGERPDGTLPKDWAWEMFKVVDVGNIIVPPKPKFDVSKLIGKSIALYNPTQKSFVRMPTGTYMDKSPQRPDGTLPDNWEWEVFKVVDGGNGMIALYSTLHKRFVRMPTGNNMDK